MSQTETNIGEANLLQGETTKSLCKKLGLRITSDNLTYREMIYDKYYGKYIIIDDDTIYETNNKNKTDDNIFFATKTPNGTISYVLQYYNGGCSFCEAFKEAIKNMEKNNE